MKVAVLFQGRVRTNDDTVVSCVNHVKQQLLTQLPQHEFEFFFFTWDFTENPDINTDKYNGIANYFLWDKAPTDEYLDSINWKWTQNCEHDLSARAVHRKGMFSIIYSQHSCLKSIEEKLSHKNYDLFLRVRNDLIIDTDFTTWFNNFDVNNLSTNISYVTAEAYWNLGSVNDHICLLTLGNAKKLFMNNWDLWKKHMVESWNFETTFRKMIVDETQLRHIVADSSRYIIKRPLGHPGTVDGNWILK